MGNMERRKGKRFEQWVARQFRAIGFKNAATKRAGGESASVDRGRDILHVEGFCIQCKVGKLPPIWTAAHEAAAARGDYEAAVAIVKRDREDPLVVMTFADFMSLAIDRLECINSDPA